MYCISEFCRICLQFEKPLVDIMKKENEQETLINKLKLCVSEVEWSMNENLFMCQTCVEKLNLAFEFKQQCLQSTQALEHYLSQFMKSGESEENRDSSKQSKEDEESLKPTAYIHVQPNQPLISALPNIILATTNNTNHNTFQNILLNLIPTNTLKHNTSTLTLGSKANNTKNSSQSQIKDANQNMFLTINNTLHKFVPILPQSKEKYGSMQSPTSQKIEDLNISKILTQSMTEELSVEIDPAVYDCEDESLYNDENSDSAKDWEELISSSKIGLDAEHKNEQVASITNITSKLVEPLTDSCFNHNITDKLDQSLDTVGTNNLSQFRPTSLNDYLTSEFEEKMMEFLNVDHFMVPSENFEYLPNEVYLSSLMCEQCGQTCDSLKSLHNHIKEFHLGKFLYKCKYCSSEYALKAQYESHMQKHLINASDAFSRDTITLEDLSINKEASLFPNLSTVPLSPNSSDFMEGEDGFEYRCELCPRSFNSPHGLSRHKVRKHNQQNRRKYFIKGMKNAKCDICNREFSTQSYLQLHIKLHYRKNDYRLKVFNKEKYGKELSEQDRTISEKEEQESKKSDEEVCGKLHAPTENEPSKNNSETDSNTKEERTLNSNKEQTDVQETAETKSEEVSMETELLNKNEDCENRDSSKGIKITINLRNLKKNKTVNRKSKSPPKENDKENMENENVELTMEVEQVCEETVINGLPKDNEICKDKNNEREKDDRMTPNLNHTSRNINTNCNESVDILSPNSELSEEMEITKEEGTPIARRPPIKIEMVNGKPMCNYCNKLFHRKHDLKRHINNIHLKAIQYRCHLCNSQFYEAFHLTRHLRQHNGFVRCAICLKEFSVLRDLKLHMNSAHENLSSCQCGTCDQVFERIKHLRDHMQEHDKSITYKCHICNSEFRESRDLSKHLVEHSGMYSCNVCHTTFSTEQELNTHVKYHNKKIADDRKYECEICHSRYKKKRYLLIHMNNCHSTNKPNRGNTNNRVDSENQFL